LLGLHSDFFSNIFYGPYLEKTQEVKEIKDVDEDKFIEFVKSIHRKKFVFESVENALDALEFSDRFLMSKIAEKVLPYLKKMSIPQNLLGYALKAADKVPNNEDIIAWILTQFRSKSSILDALHDILPFVSADTSRLCLESSRARSEERLALVKDLSNSNKLVIHLRCFNEDNRIEFEDVFSVVNLFDNEFRGMQLWRKIPIEYSSVMIGEQNKKRGEGISYKSCDTGKVVVVNAHPA
ncbi:hypothetical protein PFISCL1PPCAC_25605, partial [Pristionchus fissidentatus]